MVGTTNKNLLNNKSTSFTISTSSLNKIHKIFDSFFKNLDHPQSGFLSKSFTNQYNQKLQQINCNKCKKHEKNHKRQDL